MSVLKGISVCLLGLLMVACASVKTEQVGVMQAVMSPADLERASVEQEIARISKKLKDKPTVKGWMLVGDAQMYLKKYNDAIEAYREAYILSEYAKETRSKLKRAMYFSSLEPKKTDLEDQ